MKRVESSRVRLTSGQIVRGLLIVAVVVPVMSVVAETSAAAAVPALVQSAAGHGSNGTSGSTVGLSATLSQPCAAGDTLIAMVTIAQQNSAGGMVSTTPPGWRRLFEHSPVDTSPYQGWFALSNCSGTQNATFSVTAPHDSAGTSGSVVLDEFSGLPNPVAQDFSVNDGSSSSLTNNTLTGQSPAASGELTLAALSFYGGSPTSSTPSGWSAAGSEKTTLPAFSYWKVGTSSKPSASFSWSPAASFEVTMLALKAGPASAAPNVVQENQGAFSGQSSWSVNVPNGIAAGDAVVALIGTDVAGSTGPGFEATGIAGGGMTWQHVDGFVQSGNGSAEVWVGFASSGTSGSTPVTATMAGSLDGHMVVSEVSGIAAVDASSTSDGTGSSPTANSITPHAGDFLTGMVTANSTSLVTHPQPNWSTFSLAAPSYGMEWQSDVPNAASVPQWSTSSSGAWTTVQAAFSVAPLSSGSVNPVGGLTKAHGNGITTLAVSPTNVGDVFVLGIRPFSGTVTVSAVAGGGVSTWTKLSQHTDTSVGVDEELWMGPITTTGSSTITVTFSGSVSSTSVELFTQEFSSGLGASTTWAKDTNGSQNNSSSTKVAFPSLTATGTAELYVGYAWVAQTGAAGSNAGTTYDVLPVSEDVFLFDPSVSGTFAPSATQSPGGTSSSVGALLSASG